MQASVGPVRSASRRASMLETLGELYRYRILIATLVQRQLKARYRGSFLGFFWTILNPLLLMAVYALVFRYYMRFDVDDYAVFLLCGILPWTYFAASLSEGTNSILSGGGLITKSLFPPHVLPTVVVLSQLVNYLLSLPILVFFMVLYGVPLQVSLAALPLIVILQTLFTWGLVLALAALNVHFRDVQHILGNVLLLWFFLSPVIYPADQIPESLRIVHYLNPVGVMIEAYHGVLLYGSLPSWEVAGALSAVTVVTAWIGIRVFEAYRETFPELV